MSDVLFKGCRIHQFHSGRLGRGSRRVGHLLSLRCCDVVCQLVFVFSNVIKGVNIAWLTVSLVQAIVLSGANNARTSHHRRLLRRGDRFSDALVLHLGGWLLSAKAGHGSEACISW